MMTAMTELTVREGDGDAARTGYWTVTGPQDEHEVHAVIERSRVVESDQDVFAWYLYQRATNVYRVSGMHQSASGRAMTYEQALAEVETAWQEHVRDLEVTAEIPYPWQAN
jgi:hypothetical protein